MNKIVVAIAKTIVTYGGWQIVMAIAKKLIS